MPVSASNHAATKGVISAPKYSHEAVLFRTLSLLSKPVFLIIVALR